MTDPTLSLRDLPSPPLFKLVDAEGEDLLAVAEIGGEEAVVGVMLSSRDLAREFASEASEYGMASLAGGEVEEVLDWRGVSEYAEAGAEYLLVVSEAGTGLFHAADVARFAAEKGGEVSFPLYFFTDEGGEAPLVRVEDPGEEVSVVALFTSSGAAAAFRERAGHLGLPETLGAIRDRDGLRRHALLAREAGAGYAVVDPEGGPSEAIPLDEWVSG